jgi:hypothetical protein
MQWAFGPGDGIRLDLFRRAMAWTLLLYTLAWGRWATEWLTPVGFHPSPEATRGFQLPVPLLGETSVWIVLGVYALALGAVIVGYRPRLASVVVLCSLVYVSTADRLAMFSMNKTFMVTWALLIIAPLTRTKAGEWQLRSVWPIRILQSTLILLYFGAGLCKAVYGDYLDYDDVLWHQLQIEFMTDQSAWMVRNLPMWFFSVSQWAALSFELLAPVLFIVPRLRPLGFAWGLAMHLLIGLTMYQVGYFALMVVCFYVLFADERFLHAIQERLKPTEKRSAPDAAR